MNTIPFGKETLWTLIVAPSVWAVHFLACYILAAVFCAKPGLLPFDFLGLRLVIGGMTLAALAAIAAAGYQAWWQWGFGVHDPPHADDTVEDRRRFQGFATLLLCGLSFVAVVYTALPAVVMTACW
ncbi:hypothetical protein [Marinivivus vitaminiproducens]|uniref:hypothetical protein n=1 Tax=Marinivivus vitaminiproducens TaxID=3035935 RepID=UPI0027A79729|nr:hypothetical protein P4R82_18510 [Geminicoccaceae bacterium SCSIO 64248]